MALTTDPPPTTLPAGTLKVFPPSAACGVLGSGIQRYGTGKYAPGTSTLGSFWSVGPASITRTFTAWMVGIGIRC